MQLARPLLAMDPKQFGKGPRRQLPITETRPRISSDVTLFATTFVAGFLVTSILIA